MASPSGSLNLTFKLLLQFLLVTEHDPAIDGHQPESQRVKGVAQWAGAAKTAARRSAIGTI
jgi:hypothetical protein